jgi:hypothetical protein
MNEHHKEPYLRLSNKCSGRTISKSKRYELPLFSSSVSLSEKEETKMGEKLNQNSVEFRSAFLALTFLLHSRMHLMKTEFVS